MFQTITNTLNEMCEAIDFAYKVADEIKKSSDMILSSSYKISSSFENIYNISFSDHKKNSFFHVNNFFTTLSDELDFVKENAFSNISFVNNTYVDDIVRGKNSWKWSDRLSELDCYLSDFSLSYFDKKNIFEKLNESSYLKQKKSDLYLDFVAKYI
ncbi:MAG: hypothetical protein ACMXX6_00420 [Candidatus Woesearchaeota archaeon]